MIRNKLIRMATTAWSVACIARDLWQGLNAGSLHWTCESCGRVVGREHPEELVRVHGALVCRRCLRSLDDDIAAELDGDLIDEDPPRPVVVWALRGGPNRTWFHAAAEGWVAHVEDEYRAWRWEVSRCDAQMEPNEYEGAVGYTTLGEAEAKRRAEEALAVMLELQT